MTGIVRIKQDLSFGSHLDTRNFVGPAIACDEIIIDSNNTTRIQK